jgi:hypothetical protein
MKVNIHGKGCIPGIGSLAPTYGVEMSYQQIQRLLNFPAFRVFTANGNAQIITKKNIDEVVLGNTAEPVKEVAPVQVEAAPVEEVVPEEAVDVEELITAAEEEAAEEVVDEPTPLEVETVDPVDEGEQINDDETVAPVKESSEQYYSKKNKKHHK